VNWSGSDGDLGTSFEKATINDRKKEASMFP
jgi:hypothetical protein